MKRCEQWHPTRTEAIDAFERKCKRAGIRPPERYPPGVSGDSITNNDVAYPRRKCAAGMRGEHGTVYVEARNDAGNGINEGSKPSPGVRCGLYGEAKSAELALAWPAADAGTVINPSAGAGI